MDSTYFLRK